MKETQPTIDELLKRVKAESKEFCKALDARSLVMMPKIEAEVSNRIWQMLVGMKRKEAASAASHLYTFFMHEVELDLNKKEENLQAAKRRNENRERENERTDALRRQAKVDKAIAMLTNGEAAKPRPLPLGVSHKGAEELCAQWMRYLGQSDAHVTRYSQDGGVDVESEHYVAQVKN